MLLRGLVKKFSRNDRRTGHRISSLDNSMMLRNRKVHPEGEEYYQRLTNALNHGVQFFICLMVQSSN